MPRLITTPQIPKLPPVTLDYLQYGASEGNRNAAAFAAAVQFRDARKAIEEACIEIVPRGMADGLSEHEVRNAIKSAYSRPPREPIGGLCLSALPVLRYSRRLRLKVLGLNYPKATISTHCWRAIKNDKKRCSRD